MDRFYIDSEAGFDLTDAEYYAGMQGLADYADGCIFGVWFENEIYDDLYI